MAYNLDSPRQPGEKRIKKRFSSDTFGNFAESFARFMGTAKFLIWMTVFVIVWISANLILMRFNVAADPYPFILLNLCFSVQASYAAPLILLAQNRQEARDRMSLEHDRKTAALAQANTDYLAREVSDLRDRVNELASRDFVRGELRDIERSLELLLERTEAAKADEAQRLSG